MKVVAACVAVLGLAGLMYVARAADSSSRPPGVEAGHWYRISDRLGFVVARDRGVIDGGRQTLVVAPEDLGADLLAPLKGYFVVQTPTGWRAIVMTEPVPIKR